MKLSDIVDSIQRNVSGGKTTQGDILDPKYIKKNIDTFRAEIIARNFKRNGMINPVCYQKYYLTYNKDLQVSSYNNLLFPCPPVIQLGPEDGFRFVGSIDCSQQWIRVINRGQLSNLNANEFTRISNTDDIYYLYDGPRRLFEVYNDADVRTGLVEAIFANPLEVPTYNEWNDDYPLNIDDIAELQDLLYKNRFGITKATKPDLEFNQPQGTVAAPPRQEKLN
jgi:hypothetical protein